MLETLQPYLLLGSWIALGISVGFVAAHTLFGVVRGVRTVWPVAFLFTVTGYMAADLPGMLGGLVCSAIVGWFVGRAS
jgi:hypothetical protein